MITFAEYGQKLIEDFVEKYDDIHCIEAIDWEMPNYSLKDDTLTGSLTIKSVGPINRTYLALMIDAILDIQVTSMTAGVLSQDDLDVEPNLRCTSVQCEMSLSDHYELKLANFLTGNLENMEYSWRPIHA